ncbi:hypothetical protein D9619_006764 [Psilocybe cf. subviscida]|uniref:Uncharacterized protein n=1 Tax=Psilocybe cf. subviscida TaxID=2480587 RepID=A0A8H5B4D8_9AGAR|nr:hypothetical protein D9619_006764 [Psilocybe cf. subviscida]
MSTSTQYVRSPYVPPWPFAINFKKTKVIVESNGVYYVGLAFTSKESWITPAGSTQRILTDTIFVRFADGSLKKEFRGNLRLASADAELSPTGPP